MNTQLEQNFPWHNISRGADLFTPGGVSRSFSRSMLAIISALLLLSGSAWAQTSNSSNSSSEDEDIVVLDPFTVATEFEGYKAVDTLGGARVRTELINTPSSLSVVTLKLMQDLSVNNAEELMVYTTNTEVAGLNGNFSGIASRGFGVVGNAEGGRLINPPAVNRSRGLTAMDGTRNYFQSQIPWDGFNISRVDISRGPNSFLFGVGSPSGISNVSTNEAVDSQFGSIEAHIGSYGSTRQSLDYNFIVIPRELSVRLDLVNDDTRYKQKPAYTHTKRAYLAARYEPSFLNASTNRTRIQFNYEHGEVNSNNPRTLPPMDFYSGYFEGNPEGYDPFQFVRNEAGFDPDANIWVSQDDIHYAWGNNSTYWYDGVSGVLLHAAQAGAGGVREDGNYVSGFNGVGNAYHLYTAGFSHYAIARNFQDSTMYPGAYDRTVTYLDKTMTDPSVFDFYNKLIDGPNKHEWQDWDAFNVSVVQTLFDDRLSIQAVATHEEYNRGQDGLLTGYLAPWISVDVDAYDLTYPSWLPGASTNSNVGRPFTAGDTGGGDNGSYFQNDNLQLTVAYSLRLEDFMKESALTRFFGHQEFTALGGRYRSDQEDRYWQMYANDMAFGEASGHGITLGARNINWVAYLGDSLAGRSSASGANLSNLSTPMVPTTGPVNIFVGDWTAGDGVDPADPWVNPLPTGDVTWSQIENPANYAGYQPVTAGVHNSRTSDIEQLYNNGNKKRQTLTSAALLYQGYLWDEAIIPSFGWRRDKVRQQGTVAPIDPSTNRASMNYKMDDPGVILNTTSVSYGVAVHTAKIFKNLYPEGTDVSLYYFHGSNQTPRVRYGINGIQLPNEEGETDDFSIQLDTMNGDATFRLTFFKTVDNYASASYGQPLGANGWLIDSLPSWTLGFAATAGAAHTLGVDNLPDELVWNSWIWGWINDFPESADQILASMQTDFVELFPQSYWDQYGLPVDVSAIQAGDWLNVLSNGATPMPWNIANSHLIHGTTPVIDQNLVSKGIELEATIRPMSNWDITLNASKVRAYQTSLGQGAADYLNGMARLYLETATGMTPQWGNYYGPVSDQFLSGLWAPYLTQVALTGTDQPELRKWNFKVITNYTFNEGRFSGVNIGGAYRWASEPIVGYGISEDTVYGETAWIADVNKPLRGPTDSHIDLWIGYERSLSEKLDWRIQLNIKSVGENPGLVPVAYQPDGTVAQSRIDMGQSFDFSMKFMF